MPRSYIRTCFRGLSGMWFTTTTLSLWFDRSFNVDGSSPFEIPRYHGKVSALSLEPDEHTLHKKTKHEKGAGYLVGHTGIITSNITSPAGSYLRGGFGILFDPVNRLK
jgi:hypothetical protein